MASEEIIFIIMPPQLLPLMASEEIIFIIMPPNFEEVEGAYWFGPVHPSIRPLHLDTVKNR